MAGSIALSLTQRYDKNSHEPLAGGLLYFYAAGTTTPQSAYQDISLTIPWPNPMTLDSGGNVSQLFFADGYIKFRLANADGVTQIEADFVLVLGPTAGAGSAPSVDATTILAAGDIKVRYGTGILTGFVRANGRTIGSATSGASERANADCQTLFEYLWTTDANLSVSTGRGASANADWVANKTIALPDWRGRYIAGLDDMGNSAAGRLTNSYFGGAPTTLGNAGGLEYHVLTVGELPAAPPASGTTTNTLGVTHPMKGSVDGGTKDATSFRWGNNTGDVTTLNINPTGTVTVTGNLGGGGAHTIASPAMQTTIYIKL